MIAQNTLFPGTPKGLDYLASLYCEYYWFWKLDGKEWNWRTDSLEQLLEYNCLDVMRTFEVATNQLQYTTQVGMEQQLAFKHYIHHMCLRMMNRGTLIDINRRGRLLSELVEFKTEVEEELLQIIPQDWLRIRKKPTDAFWFNSDKQTKNLFYGLFNFKRILDKHTKRPTTGKEALKQFKINRPEFSGLIDRLDTHGSVGNSIQVIKTPLEHNNRMMCSYNPAGTETHRLSSSKNAFGRGTNLQNLTSGEEDK